VVVVVVYLTPLPPLHTWRGVFVAAAVVKKSAAARDFERRTGVMTNNGGNKVVGIGFLSCVLALGEVMSDE